MTSSSLSTECEDSDDKKEENILSTAKECENNVAQDSKTGKFEHTKRIDEYLFLQYACISAKLYTYMYEACFFSATRCNNHFRSQLWLFKNECKVYLNCNLVRPNVSTLQSDVFIRDDLMSQAALYILEG